MRHFFLVVFLVLRRTLLVSATFLSSPTVKWTLDLASTTDSTTIRRGNAVVVSKNTNDIFVTTRQGVLQIVASSGNAERTRIYEPADLSSSSYCASGVALYEPDDVDDSKFYAVYAVVNGDDEDATSRILAVDRLGQELWSVELSGVAVGTPIVRDDGFRVYVVHNELLPRSDDNSNGGGFSFEQPVRGSVSVISVSVVPPPPQVTEGGNDQTTTSSQWFAEVTTTLSSDDYNDGQPFALGAATARVINATTTSDDDATGDTTTTPQQVLFVAAASQVGNTFNTGGEGGQGGVNGGSVAGGGLYAIFPDDEQWYLVSDSAMPTQLRPALGVDASMCFLAHGPVLTAWQAQGENNGLLSQLLQTNDDEQSSVFPSWEETLLGPDDDPFAAIPTAPVLSLDESVVYVTSAEPQIVAMETERARSIWALVLNSAAVAEPLLVRGISDTDDSDADDNGPGGENTDDSTEDTVLYVIESLLGAVRQLDVSDGTENWQANCTTVTGDEACELLVEADFSSSNGNVLYFAYTNGMVVALQVGDFATTAPKPVPTRAPSAMPAGGKQAQTSTMPPTDSIQKTSSPTAVRASEPDSDSETTESGATTNDEDNEDVMDLVAIILGAVVGGLAILVCLAVIFVWGPRRRVSKQKRQDAATKKSNADCADLEWQQNKDAYEKECQEQEELTLKEITISPAGATFAAAAAAAVNADKNAPQKQQRIADTVHGSGGSGKTPQTLHSIEESPEYSDGGSLSGDTTESGFEVSLTRRPRPIEAVPARNLNESFTQAAKSPVKNEIDPVAHAQIVQALQLSRPQSPQDSSSSGQMEVMIIEADDSFDASETGPGYIPLSLIRSSSPKWRARSPNRPISPSHSHRSSRDDVGGIITPAFSDVWSVDGSLYIDDDTTAAGSRSVKDSSSPGPVRISPSSDHPDDESATTKTKPSVPAFRPTTLLPPAPAPASPGSMALSRAAGVPIATSSPPVVKAPQTPSPIKSSPPVAKAPQTSPPVVKVPQTPSPLKSSPTSASGRKMPLHSEEVVYNNGQGTGRGASFIAGKSQQRPKAGLFTRRQLQYTSDSEKIVEPVTPVHYNSSPELEREPRAVYSPPKVSDRKETSKATKATTTAAAAAAAATTTTTTTTTNASMASSKEGSRQTRRTSNPSKSRTIKADKASTNRDVGTPKSSPTKQATSAVAGAWTGFLSELAKVEEQFFNPSTPSPPAAKSTNNKRRNSRKAPPPPRRRRQQQQQQNDDSPSSEFVDESSEVDEDSESESDAAVRSDRRFFT